MAKSLNVTERRIVPRYNKGVGVHSGRIEAAIQVVDARKALHEKNIPGRRRVMELTGWLSTLTLDKLSGSRRVNNRTFETTLMGYRSIAVEDTHFSPVGFVVVNQAQDMAVDEGFYGRDVYKPDPVHYSAQQTASLIFRGYRDTGLLKPAYQYHGAVFADAFKEVLGETQVPVEASVAQKLDELMTRD